MSSLGAVMAFLYIVYLVAYSIISTLMGRYVDARLNALGPSASPQAESAEARSALKLVAGLQFTLISVVILASTFIPKGSKSWNPMKLDGQSFGKGHEHDDDEKPTTEKDSDKGQLQLAVPI